MRYGELPANLGLYEINCLEMMFYQDMLIKLKGASKPIMEKRLACFKGLIATIMCDFVGEFGLNRYMESYTYVSAKNLYQAGFSYNRPGYHADGFGTDDINYIWSNKNPTIFNHGEFVLSDDDVQSIVDMEKQALVENEYSFPVNSLLRLNQYNIHRVAEQQPGLRTFLKVTFSRDKFDLMGNAKNYHIDYDWEMKPRKETRNIPQGTIHQPFTT